MLVLRTQYYSACAELPWLRAVFLFRMENYLLFQKTMVKRRLLHYAPDLVNPAVSLYMPHVHVAVQFWYFNGFKNNCDPCKDELIIGND